MKAEILATGDEIRTGALVDSNSAYIAERLEQMGLEVTRHLTVGDDLDVLVEIFQEVGTRADVALVTGGLGPTTDDLSAEAAAKAMGVELRLDELALKNIETLYKFAGRAMSESNRKQAYFPDGADRLDNPIGTAPGFAVTIGKCRFFFMPGVPHEMKKMLAERTIPRIEKLRGGEASVSLVRQVSTFGSTESQIGEKVADLPQKYPGVKLGLRAKFPEIQVKLYARGPDEAGVKELLKKAGNDALNRVAEFAYSDENKEMAEVLGDLLKMEKATVAVAESCTGGLIADSITNVAGCSAWFLMSAVVYDGASKVKMLGVSQQTLERHGAVHEETAREMAAGAREKSGANYAISTTGIAGPTGGSDKKPIGTVCIGIATASGAEGYRYYFPFRERERNKQIFAMTAMDLLRRRLLGLPPPRYGLVPKKES